MKKTKYYLIRINFRSGHSVVGCYTRLDVVFSPAGKISSVDAIQPPAEDMPRDFKNRIDEGRMHNYINWDEVEMVSTIDEVEQ